MKIIDLHNHSNCSADAVDSIEAIVENAYRVGLDVVGITDHNYYFHLDFSDYCRRIQALKKAYRGKLTVLLGMEIALHNYEKGLLPSMFDSFDYVLIEHAGIPTGLSWPDFFAYRKEFRCPVGLAHTDIFAMSEETGLDLPRLLAESDIFWELNVSYDRAHGYRVHRYYERFLVDGAQQEAVRRCGLKLGVGYDTHCLEDYRVERVQLASRFIQEKGLSLADIPDRSLEE